MLKLLRRLSYLFRRDRLEGELEEELRFHVEMKQRELEASGLDADTAARAARRDVGNVPLTHDQVRDVWIWPWLWDAMQDLRFSARSLRNDSGFAATAVITLALGIGVNVAVFAVAYGVLWRPLPYANPDRLVHISMEGQDGKDWGIDRSYLDEWLSRLQSTAPTGAYYSREFTLRGQGEARVLSVAHVTGDFFR